MSKPGCGSGARSATSSRRRRATRRTSSPSRSSITISAPDGHAGSIVERRPGDHERDPGRRGGQGVGVGADLVGHVAVGRHAVTADDDGVDLAGGDQAGGGAVDDQLVRDPEPAQLVDGQAGALQQRPGLGGQHQLELAAVGQLGDHRQRGPAARSGQGAGVAVGEDAQAPARPGSRRRAAPAPRWPRPPRRGSRAPRPAPPAAVPARRDAPGRRGRPGSTAWARLTAVGRDARAAPSRRRAPASPAPGRGPAPAPARSPRRRRSAARPGSTAAGSPAATSAARAQRQLDLVPRQAVWSSAHSTPSSKRSATTGPDARRPRRRSRGARSAVSWSARSGG